MTDNLERRDSVDKANAWDAIAAKNAEITRLQEALAAAEAERDRLQGEVELYATVKHSTHWKARAEAAEALLAETRKKALEAALRIAPYLIWTIGEESPGHHPTMPSAVAAFLRAFDIDTPEKRRAADHAALHEFLKADEAPK